MTTTQRPERPERPEQPGRPARPAQRTVVSTGGARLHTELLGPADAATVVLAHGWTCATAFWRPVRDRLAGTHRVVLYDQRGHGRTPATPGSCDAEALADDLCAVLEETVPPGRRAVVGGHSMGAMTVVAAASRASFRQRAAAALLCSTGVDRLASESRLVPVRSVAVRRRLQRSLLTGALPLGPVTPLGRRLLRYATLGPQAPAVVCDEVARMVHACPRTVRAEWGRVLAGLDLAARVPELTVPTAVLHGTTDRLTPPVHAHRLAGALPRPAGLHLLPGRGHMTPLEDPERVSEALRGLVRTHLTHPAPQRREAA